MKKLGWGVADANHAGACLAHDGLGDQARGVREVDNPAVGAQSFDETGMLQGHGDGAKCHGRTRRTGCFLSGIAVFDRRQFVCSSCSNATDTDAVHHKIRTFDGVLDRGCFAHAQLALFPRHD